MGSTTDRVSARARAVPVSLIRRMFDLTPRVPGAISLAVGEPGFATPPAHRRGGLPGAPRRLHQVLAEPGLPRPPGGDRGEARAGQRVPGRPGLGGLRDRGRHAGPGAHVHGRDRPGRRGARHRPELHELRRDRSRWRADGRSSCPRIPSAGTCRTSRTWRPRSPRARARSSSTARRTRRAPSTRGTSCTPSPSICVRHDLLLDLRRDVRGADVRRHPERQPGVVPRPPRPDDLDLLLLEGVRDDGLAHRLPHGAGADAARSWRPSRRRWPPASTRRPSGRPSRPIRGPQDCVETMRRAYQRRRDLVVERIEPDPRRSMPAARRRLLRVPRRPGGDPRHAAPRRAAALRPQGRRLAGRGVRPEVRRLPAALLRRLRRRSGGGPEAARGRPRRPPGSADAASGMAPGAGERRAVPPRVARRPRRRPSHLREGQRAEPPEPRRDRARARRGEGGGRARLVLTGYDRFFSAGLDLVALYGLERGRHGRVHGPVRRGHAPRLRLSAPGGGRPRLATRWPAAASWPWRATRA